jgi:hypothetical protein
MKFTHLLSTAATVAALFTVTVGSAPAWASEVQPAAVKTSTVMASWCPLGHAKNGNCRGGSINDNERLNESLEDTGQMYKEAGECAVKGVIKGKAKFWSSQKYAAICGTTKPHGKLW